MTDAQRHDFVVDLLMELKVIAGVVLQQALPQQETVGAFRKADPLDAQINAIHLFLASSHKYMGLTTNEVRQAFMLNLQGAFGDVVKHYNQPVNGEYIGQILTAFVRYKAKMGERMWDIVYALRPKQVKEIRMPASHEWEQMIQDDYRLFRMGELDLIVNIAPKYQYLKREGYIWYNNLADYHRWYQDTLRWRFARLKASNPMTEGGIIDKQRKIEYFQHIFDSGIIDKSEHRLNVHHTRRRIYLHFLKTMQETAIVNIFTDIRRERLVGDVHATV